MNNRFLPIVLPIGICGGVLSIIYFLTFYFLGTPPSDSIFAFDFWILPIFIFIGIKFFRDKLNDKKLRFWEGLALGIQVALLITVINCLFTFIFYQWIDGNFLTTYVNDVLSQHLERREEMKELPQASFNKITEEIKQISSFGIAMLKFLRNMFVGLLSVILLSVIFRR
ncbi:MAG: DUF4199 domain-containing protein [Cyclobacteriaceae bacterium]